MDTLPNNYILSQRKQLVEQQMIEKAPSLGWSAGLTEMAIKEGVLIVHPTILDWDDNCPAWWWEFSDGYDDTSLRPPVISTVDKVGCFCKKLYAVIFRH